MIDAAVAAFYAAFDNRKTQRIDVTTLRNLFTCDAHLTRSSAETTESWNAEQFIAPRARILFDGTLTDFREWECSSTSTIVGNIASQLSIYRKTVRQSGSPFIGSGTKFNKLCRCREK